MPETPGLTVRVADKATEPIAGVEHLFHFPPDRRVTTGPNGAGDATRRLT